MIDGGFALAGAVTGLVVGITGVGGGSLMTPILLLVFGIAPHTAIATDLWFAAITKIVALPFHRHQGKVDWQVARRLWIGSIPISIVVVAMIAAGGSIGKLEWLSRAIGAVVLLTAVGLVLAPWLQGLARSRRISKPDRFKRHQAAWTVVAGVLLGVLVSMTSVGAGALGTVLLLVLYPLRMTPHRLVATDIAHAIPLVLVAGVGYLFAGMVDGVMLLSLLCGSVPAVICGSVLARYFSPRWLQVVLAVVLAAVAVKTLGVG